AGKIEMLERNQNRSRALAGLGRAENGPADHVLELANVPRPVVALERTLRVARESHRPETQPAPPASEEMSGEKRDVLASVPKRRHSHGEDGQAMEEVGAKPALFHLGRKISIRRGDHANVHSMGAIRSDSLDLALLERAKQLRLDRKRKLPHLVEEERGAVRDLELSWTVLRRARERA